MKKHLELEYIEIRDVLDDLGIYYTEGGKNVSQGWIGTTCAFPGCDDVSNHLGVCLDSPVVSCFKCGGKGNYLTYLSHLLGYKQALEILNKHMPAELRRKKGKVETEKPVKVLLPEEASKTIKKRHAKFLIHRGFDYKKLHKDYDLHYCGSNSFRWENRIIVPVYQHRRLITFTSIDTDIDSELRYKHEKKDNSIIPIKQYLFGIEHAKKNVVVVVEGLLDMFRIGFGAVCTSGTQFTKEQVRELCKFQRVIVLFDGDDAGRLAAERLSVLLSPFTEVVVIELDDGVDPDEMAEDDLSEIREMIGRH